MNLLSVAVLCAAAIAVVIDAKTAQRTHGDDRKQQIDYQYPGGGDPFEGMGDDFGDSLDFVCDNFCPKPSGGQNDSHTEAIMAELMKIKEQLTAQATVLSDIQQKVNSNTGATSTVPVEYRPAYPVFHVQSDFGRYRYTLAQARQACEENGGKLASYKQIMAAWERGLDLCQCGWIDEGYAVYPIQYPREGCTTKIGPGIRYNCDWQSTWNAWCFNADIANKEL